MEWIHRDCAELSDNHNSTLWNCHLCRKTPSLLHSLTSYVDDVQIKLTRLCDLNESLLKQLSQKTEDYEKVVQENNKLKELLSKHRIQEVALASKNQYEKKQTINNNKKQKAYNAHQQKHIERSAVISGSVESTSSRDVSHVRSGLSNMQYNYQIPIVQ